MFWASQLHSYGGPDSVVGFGLIGSATANVATMIEATVMRALQDTSIVMGGSDVFDCQPALLYTVWTRSVPTPISPALSHCPAGIQVTADVAKHRQERGALAVRQC